MEGAVNGLIGEAQQILKDVTAGSAEFDEKMKAAMGRMQADADGYTHFDQYLPPFCLHIASI